MQMMPMGMEQKAPKQASVVGYDAEKKLFIIITDRTDFKAVKKTQLADFLTEYFEAKEEKTI